MAEKPPGRVALLSIHPRHAEAILDGRKLVELRRTRLSPDTTHVIIYATAPVKAVVGFFEVDGIAEGSKSAIWKAYREVCGVTRREYMGYFDGAKRAFAIRVVRPRRYGEPFAVHELPAVTRPPQSYRYLAAVAARRALGDRALRSAEEVC